MKSSAFALVAKTTLQGVASGLRASVQSRKEVGTPGHLERSVEAAIDAVQSGNQNEIVTTYAALLPLDTGDVVAELFLRVEELTDGVSESDLLQAAQLPLPPNSTEMLRAVAVRDIIGLQDAVGSDRTRQVISALLDLVAALKDARARL